MFNAAEGVLAEEDSDQAAKRGVELMVSQLTGESKRVRNEIEEIERTAPLVHDPELRREARTRIVELRWKLYKIIAAATHERYTPLEVKEWMEHAVGRGASFPLLNVSVIRDLAHIHQVPNAPLRSAVLDHLEEDEGGYETLVANAHDRLVELENTNEEDYGSAAWHIASEDEAPRKVLTFRRHLGMATHVNGRGIVYCAFLMSYEKAVAISQAIGMHPLQAGV